MTITSSKDVTVPPATNRRCSPGRQLRHVGSDWINWNNQTNEARCNHILHRGVEISLEETRATAASTAKIS